MSNVPKLIERRMAEVDWKAAGENALEPVADAMAVSERALHDYDNKSTTWGSWSLAGFLTCGTFVLLGDKTAATSLVSYVFIVACLITAVRSYRARKRLESAEERTLGLVDDLAHRFPRSNVPAEDKPAAAA